MMSKELRHKIDVKRGDIQRSKFISRSLEEFFRDRAQAGDESAVLNKQVAASHKINCEICTDTHQNIQNLSYCKCKCHGNKSQVSEPVGRSFSDAKGSPSFRDELQNDY